ncbi:MAG: DUF2505 domain-containing protein [Micrococcaceae bacterium]
MNQIAESATINKNVTDIINRIVSQEYAQATTTQAGATLASFDVQGDVNSSFSVTTVRQASSAELPSAAQSIVGDTITLTQTDNWSAPDANGNRQAQTTVTADGVPLQVDGNQRLTAQGENTQYEVNGQVECHIPLVGPKVAEAAAPFLQKAFQLQIQGLNN